MRNIIILLLVTVFISACSTSPTGRKQLKLFPANQLNTMGLQAFDQMKGEEKISKDAKTNRYVRCIADRMTPLVPKQVYSGEWEVVVFESDNVNAFALPGGRIGVYTGLLNYAKNQHQLAAVIGHEIGHVIAEHGNERMSSSAVIGVGMQLTNEYLQANNVGATPEIMSALGLGAQIGVQLPFSRTHESEADHIGLDIMSEAGFDPRQSVDLWQNMAKIPGNRPPEFLSTHPAPETRIKDLQALIPKRLEIYQKSNKASCA